MFELTKLQNKRPDLVTIDSSSQKVGGKIQKKFSTVHYKIPILSLNKVFDISGF